MVSVVSPTGLGYRICCGCGYYGPDPRRLSMPKPSVTFRPTAAQRLWLDRQRRERGIPLTTLVQLALEQAMQADQQEAQPDGDR